MNQLDIEETAKVIFFNPEMTEDIVDWVNMKHIFVDNQIQERISLYKAYMLVEIDNQENLECLKESITMLENFLNALKKSHL